MQESAHQLPGEVAWEDYTLYNGSEQRGPKCEWYSCMEPRWINQKMTMTPLSN
jgi:hypothetical protein